MDISDEGMKGFRSSSEPYARLLAEQMRSRFGCDWGLSETGAAGPTGNRYGDAAGHSCMAVSGPTAEVITLETGNNDRFANMQVFAATALKLLLRKLEG
jgi:nicotinamide mononucleotide (NMN) deamidase PncC